MQIRKIWGDTPDVLVSKIKSIKSIDLENCIEVVFKISRKLLTVLATNPKYGKQVYNRLLGKKVYFLVYDIDIDKPGTIEIYQLHKRKVSQLKNSQKTKTLLKRIRANDLGEIVINSLSNIRLDAPKGSHFRTPSGKHTRQFIRLADALSSHNSLDRLSFWLRTYLDGIDAVMVDSWSLSPVVLKTQLLLGKHIEFDCFENHPSKDETAAKQKIESLLKKLNNNKKVLVLVSVSSSGHSLKKINQYFEEVDSQTSVYKLSLYKFANTGSEINSLCELDIELEYYTENECLLCDDPITSQIHEIDSRSYYPKTHSENVRRITRNLVNDPDNKSQKGQMYNFVKRYSKSGVFALHKDDPHDGVRPRHHCFYIDVFQALRDQRFVKEVVQKLTNQYPDGSINVLISPDHKAGIALTEVIKSNFKVATTLNKNSLIQLDKNELSELCVAREVLIVDDVLITGSRLRGYLNDLRKIFGDNEHRNKTVRWFPCVARPERYSELTSIEDGLGNHGGKVQYLLDCLYSFELPNLNSELECSWCREHKILSRINKDFKPNEFVMERLRLLSDTSSGLTNEALFLSKSIKNRSHLASGSIFSPSGTDEVALIFVLASVMQRLRNDPNYPLGQQLLSGNVLKLFTAQSKKGLFTRYTEPLIQAALLRVISPCELSSDTNRKDMKNVLNLICESTHTGIALEFLLFCETQQYYGGQNLVDIANSYCQEIGATMPELTTLFPISFNGLS